MACNDLTAEAAGACARRIERNGGTAIRVNSFTPTAPTPDNPELLAARAAAGADGRARPADLAGRARD